MIHLPAFADDILILLPPGATFDIAAGMERVQKEIIPLLPAIRGRGRIAPSEGPNGDIRKVARVGAREPAR